MNLPIPNKPEIDYKEINQTTLSKPKKEENKAKVNPYFKNKQKQIDLLDFDLINDEDNIFNGKCFTLDLFNKGKNITKSLKLLKDKNKNKIYFYEASQIKNTVKKSYNYLNNKDKITITKSNMNNNNNTLNKKKNITPLYSKCIEKETNKFSLLPCINVKTAYAHFIRRIKFLRRKKYIDIKNNNDANINDSDEDSQVPQIETITNSRITNNASYNNILGFIKTEVQKFVYKIIEASNINFDNVLKLNNDDLEKAINILLHLYSIVRTKNNFNYNSNVKLKTTSNKILIKDDDVVDVNNVFYEDSNNNGNEGIIGDNSKKDNENNINININAVNTDDNTKSTCINEKFDVAKYKSDYINKNKVIVEDEKLKANIIVTLTNEFYRYFQMTYNFYNFNTIIIETVDSIHSKYFLVSVILDFLYLSNTSSENTFNEASLYDFFSLNIKATNDFLLLSFSQNNNTSENSTADIKNIALPIPKYDFNNCKLLNEYILNISNLHLEIDRLFMFSQKNNLDFYLNNKEHKFLLLLKVSPSSIMNILTNKEFYGLYHYYGKGYLLSDHLFGVLSKSEIENPNDVFILFVEVKLSNFCNGKEMKTECCLNGNINAYYNSGKYSATNKGCFNFMFKVLDPFDSSKETIVNRNVYFEKDHKRDYSFGYDRFNLFKEYFTTERSDFEPLFLAKIRKTHFNK